MSDLLSIIREVEAECHEKRLFPVCASLIDVRDRYPPEKRDKLSEELERLKREGKVKTWEAINDIMIQMI